ncbi:MAG: HD domain-containing protein [Candidatus Nomurabacteria bacterium]|jgi:uncharacterized protein|nr:HD domain-containing protein [Candidatus Nomurabacteria bacterium]
MTKAEILEIVAAKVREIKLHDTSNDWWKIWRVNNSAKIIAQRERADEFIVSMIVLLQDVYDWKDFPDIDIEQSLRDFLDDLNVVGSLSENEIKTIVHDAANTSYKGEQIPPKLSKEGKIAQDANNLDNIGAIVIARTFAYGGHKNRAIYDPDMGINKNPTATEYQDRNRKGHSIEHFYEKLLKLKDLMNTETARQMAEHRHKFMEDYLREFFDEWNGVL